MSNDAAVLQAAIAFQDAWDAHDLEGTLALITDDCVFESGRPDVLGARHEGKEVLREIWAPVFANASGHFEIEERIVGGDRVTVLWTMVLDDRRVRGLDVLKVRDGKISEKLGYVKVSG
jgi:ketosteroid isomerase-like protein